MIEIKINCSKHAGIANKLVTVFAGITAPNRDPAMSIGRIPASTHNQTSAPGQFSGFDKTCTAILRWGGFDRVSAPGQIRKPIMFVPRPHQNA